MKDLLSQEMPLSYAKSRRSYVIMSVENAGEARRRLLDMGFTCGSTLFLEGFAFKKRTVLVLIRGAYIALRQDAADAVIVRTVI